MIEINNLVKRYGDLTALNHLQLSVKKGDVLGLLGPNGCGKTTAINCMLSLLRFDRGEIKLFGERMAPDRYDLKRRIGVVTQEIAVFEELTVLDNIDYYCGLYIDDKNQRQICVADVIKLVGLEDFRKFRPKQLSGGLKRRLNIACGIAHKPELIFLDEPTVAVDPQSRSRILESIKELNRQGATIVYTTHYMEEVELLCNQIVIMDQGKVIAEGTKEELKSMVRDEDKLVVAASGLTPQQQQVIQQLPGVVKIDYHAGQLTLHSSSLELSLLPLLEYFKEQAIAYAHLHTEEATLNDVFLAITGKGLRD